MRIIALCGNSQSGQNEAGAVLCRNHNFVIVNATSEELVSLVSAIQNGHSVGVAALAAQAAAAAIVRGEGGEVWHILKPPVPEGYRISHVESGDIIVPFDRGVEDLHRTIEGVYQNG